MWMSEWPEAELAIPGVEKVRGVGADAEADVALLEGRQDARRPEASFVMLAVTPMALR